MAQTLWEKVLDGRAKPPAGSGEDWRSEHAETIAQTGVVQHRLGRNQEALTSLHKAIAMQQRLVEGTVGMTDYRVVLAGYYRELAKVLREMGRLAEARAAVGEWNKLRPANPDALFRMACEQALLASAVAKGKPKLSPEEQAERQKDVELGLSLLQEAIQHGFRDAERLRTAPELEPLRGLDEFKALVNSVEKQGKKSP